MMNMTWKQRLQQLITPALMLVLGVVLLVRPDSASALVGKVLAWCLIAVGVLCAAYCAKERSYIVIRAIPAFACFAVGIWLLRNPLALAAALGRLAGVIIVLQGVQDVLHAIEWKRGLLWGIVATAAGVLLLLVPMTASRLVMGLCGIALIMLGGAIGWGRIKGKKLPLDPEADVIEMPVVEAEVIDVDVTDVQ